MIYALAAAVVIGLCLGLLGSGGSILTVPVLVYIVGRPEKAAIAESLAIVAMIAASGAALAAWRRRVDFREVLWFGLPGMGGTYAGAALSRYVSGELQLVIFAIVMLAAAVLMFRGSARPPAGANADAEQPRGKPHALWALSIEGAGVGTLTGFVGVGGGFLIVPALVLLGSLPMRRAIGTSLAIITIMATTGFVKQLTVIDGLGLSVAWPTIAMFGAVGVVGSVIGSHLAGRLPQHVLRRIFAVFLVAMGVFMMIREGSALLRADDATATQDQLHTQG